MTNFWELSDSQTAQSTGTFESGGGSMEPIPNNTDVIAAADEIKWDEYKGDHYISVRWSVLQPAEYKNRKIFQKIRVEDQDPKKQDKAKLMLAAIDKNAGGALAEAGIKPTNEGLTRAIVNKPMILKLMVWEIDKDDGTKANGNWVCAVSPKQKAQTAAVTVDVNEDTPF